jgi:hypothetical protein
MTTRIIDVVLNTAQATAQLAQLNRGVGSTSSSFAAFSKVALGVTAAVVSLGKVIDVAKRFQKLEAQLKIATGSAERATEVFGKLRQIANKLPESVEDTTTAFLRLKNLGLNPTEESLVAFSNVAASSGKTIIEFVEGVADAATGEFERLKEFGIKASKQGENVELTFQGLTTSMKNNSENIQKYLTDIGKNQFAGAAEAQMATIGGAMTQLGNQTEELWFSISELGVADAVSDSLRTLTESLGELTQFISSGEFSGRIETWMDLWVDGFNEIQEEVEKTFDFEGSGAGDFMRALDDTFRIIISSLKDGIGFLVDSVVSIPTNLVAAIKVAKIFIDDFIRAVESKFKALNIKMAETFDFFGNNTDTINALKGELKSLEDLNEIKFRQSQQEVGRILKERELKKASFDKEIEQVEKTAEAKIKAIESVKLISDADAIKIKEEEETFKSDGKAISSINKLGGSGDATLLGGELTSAIDSTNAISEALNAETDLIREAAAERLNIKAEEVDLKTQLSKEEAAALEGVQNASASAQKNIAKTSFVDALTMFSGSSKKIFKLKKALALTEAAVALPSAVIESYKNAGGYPFGIPAALGMAAVGISQIRKIQSTSFGAAPSTSTSTGGGGGGGASSIPSPASRVGQQSQNSTPTRDVTTFKTSGQNEILQELRDMDSEFIPTSTARKMAVALSNVNNESGIPTQGFNE